MTSDKWGPVPFVLAHAENITPNYPEGEFRPEILVGYLDGFIRNSNGEYDHIQIRIPIYGEESVTSNSSNDNSDSQTSTSSNNGEGLFNREYIASEKKYKNYCLGFELDLVDDPNWGIVTVYDTPEQINNQFIHGDYEKFIEKCYNGKTVDDIGATWDAKNTSILITTSTNRIDSWGFTPEDTGIDTDFDDAYQFSEFYINYFKDIILKQGGICENLGRVEINGINGCLVKVRWADSFNTLIIFFSDKLDSDACFDMQIDTGTPSDERIPEVLEYLNQHLRKIN